MNQQRRKAIADVISQIEAIKSEEQEYLDNMPESMQSGDKGQQAEEAISSLDEAISSLENATN